MSKSEVIFSVFDPKLGPIPIFSTNKGNEEFGQKIAFKSQLTLSMVDTSIETAEAVLPFPDAGKIAFVFLFGIRTTSSDTDPHTKCVASLSYTEDISEQINLYKKIPLLKKQATSIANALKADFLYTGRGQQKLSKKLIELLRNYGEALEIEMDVIESELASKKISIRESKEGTIDYLLKTIKKGLEVVIYALIVEEPVIVIGDLTTTPLVIGSLELLVPFKMLRKIEFTRNYVSPQEADVIGIDENLKKYYSSKDFVVVNVKKGKVDGPYKSSFLNSLVKDLKKLNNEESNRKFIQSEISKALSAANYLIEICNVPNPSKERISGFKKRTAPDVMELILAIATSYNPVIADHVKGEVSQIFTDWLDGL
ncbi:MAG: hypothetical protein ACXADA_22325 [Candidatus Hodarchaeales archaeon]|jgi:hypothetical protein